MHDIISHVLIGLINIWGTVLLSRMLTESRDCISRAGVAVLTAAGVVSTSCVILNFAVVYVLVDRMMF